MRLEPVADPTLARTVLPPVAAGIFTVVVGMALAWVAGGEPLSVMGEIVEGAVGSRFALLETLNRATPLIFTGLAVAVAFRAKLWNIGAEAQLYAGALMTVVLATGALAWPGWLLIPATALAAIAAGALCLVWAAWAKVRLGVDEVVTTLLFNFVMLLIVSMLLEGPLKDPMGMGWPKSERIVADARLPRIADGLRLHWGFGVALLCAAAIWFVQARTTWGFEIRAVGASLPAARFAGIPVTATIIRTAVLSGGLAALAGWSEVAGSKGALTLDLSPGYGYTGIVVAMLALLHPLGVVATALLAAGVFVGADAMSRSAGVPSYVADILLATALLATVLALLLTRYRVRRG